MDVSGYSKEELLLAAIKSEVESEKVYSGLAERVRNSFLKDRLKFLAGEERKHRAYLEGLYREVSGKRYVSIPEGTPVPLPVVELNPDAPVSNVIEQAMEAELAAQKFYQAISTLFEGEKRAMLMVLSRMEESHYHLLEMELENLRSLEDYDTAWSMMHSGP